ncbi:hypothetical protein SAMN04488506_0552 [Desemzia incerta]|uniref:Uncharacterized protein n=1 Tax=Desemzia incerta TaxID=82801 RepID=A0A1I5VRZ5_9LACT|nr:hypothetical protein [Desemzia incerta]SFQ10221.1 hypothetical protein SAMN04488506_0552 [Desemzia incerta]
MATTKNANQFSKTKKEITLKDNNSEKNVTIRKRPFEKHKEKRHLQLLSIIVAQLPNIPIFVEELKLHGEIALDISQEMAVKLANGEITFGTYTESGTKYAQFVNSKTGQIFKNIPIKEVPVNFGPAIATAGLTMQLEEITRQLDLLGEKVNRVNRNFDLNRYAEVQSAKEKYEMAMLSKNAETKQTLLHNALTQATDAKNLLLNQLLESKIQLESQKLNNKIPIFSSNISAAEGDKLAQIALENLSYMKDAFSIQITSLFELGEFDVLNYAVCEFKEMIIENFSGTDALFLDEHLSIPTNPFKFLSNNVVEASDSIIKFLDENEELFEVYFMPDFLEIADKKEVK